MPAAQIDNLAHTWMSHAPVPILAVGADGRVCWANHALETTVGLPASQLLGHDRDSLPSPTHRVLFTTAGTIHLNGPGAPERWLRCESRDGDDGLRLLFYTDITREVLLAEEKRRLQGEIEDLRTTDALTGLANRRAMIQHLELHVSRSRRYGNPLSLAHIRVGASGPEGVADAAVLTLARHLRDRLRWVDQVARWDAWEFLIALPETGEAEAREVIANLVRAEELPALTAPFDGVSLQIGYGIASWQRGDDSRTLRQRAWAELQDARRASNG